jgi:outer membrane protein assembly factor BamB
MPWLRSLLLLLLAAGVSAAEDWPQWLGPHRDGSSSEKIKPWKGDLTVLWRQAVGAGHSSPVIAGGKVYLLTRGLNKDRPGSEKKDDLVQETEELAAFDAVTGKEAWRTGYPREKFFSPFGTGPQATPAVIDGKVYTFGATGILTCFDAGKGTILWQKDTLKTFGATNLFFGVASSPLIVEDKVLVNVGAKGASVVAFHKDDGKVVWKALDDRASYASGITIPEGKEQAILFLTQAGLRALAPEDGKLLWEFPLMDRLNENSTTPVRAGNFLLASSITQGMVGLDLSQRDKGTPKVAWRNKDLTCYFSTPIPVGKEHVYLVTGTLGFKPSSTLHCVELKTGKSVWSQKDIGKWHAAMLRTADDKLLLLSDLGNLILLDPTPDGYKELARSRLVKREQIWAHPALSNGRVYLRDEKELICVQMPE